MCPVYSTIAIEAVVAAVSSMIAAADPWLVSSTASIHCATMIAAFRLVLLAATGTSTTISLILESHLLVEGSPLLGGVEELASDRHPLRRAHILDRFEPLDDVLDRELPKVEQSLNGEHHMLVLLQHASEKLLHGALLVEVGVAVTRHLLHEVGEAQRKLLDLLPWPKGESFPLASKLLQSGVLNALVADAPGRDRLPDKLGGPLVGDGSAQLWWNSGAESLQGAPIVLVQRVAVADRLPEPSRLKLDLH